MFKSSNLDLLVTLLVIIVDFDNVQCTQKPNPTIAIIGAGLGGTSAAHFLREVFDSSATIDIYEKGDVGGRLATVEIGGQYYDSGATILHPKNMYMVKFRDMFGLKEKDKAGGTVGVFDGQQLVHQGSSMFLLNMAKMMWRYGWSIYKIKNEVEVTIEHFSNIYHWQDEGVAFTTIEKLLNSMSPEFSKMLNKSMADDMIQGGYSELFINELAGGGMLSNYGQDATNLHAFVGAVAMAGVQPGLWNVYGGNTQIPEKLIEHSRARLLQEEVLKVTLKSGSSLYEVETKQRVQLYDIVIVACPLEKHMSDIKFENFPKPIGSLSGRFHRTVATFVQGKINASFFGLTDETQVPSIVLMSNQKFMFNSLGRQVPINFKKNEKTPKGNTVWKVFSQKPLTDPELSQLFVEKNEIKIVDWLAYPHYKSPPDSYPDFELYPRLYYINGIEWAASALEMSALAARNVALLARHKWFDDSGHIDQHATVSDGTTKSEL